MPAVTVDNLLILPRVNEPVPTAEERSVLKVTTAPSAYEGEGFPVRRAFAGVDLRQLDPFIHMDQMGEVEYAPGEPKGTPWHPHRGFETVTYMIDGTFRHQDSNGGGGLITNGDTQWMTAGAGLLHIEAPTEDVVITGGLFHGFQLWVNLPASLKMTQPRYQDIRSGQVALLTSPDGGALLRVIAGELDGHSGPGITHTPITLVHATVSPGAQVRLPWRADFNALGYVLGGAGSVGTEHRPVKTARAQPVDQSRVYGDHMARTATVVRSFRRAQKALYKRIDRDVVAPIIHIRDAADDLAIAQIERIAVAHGGFEPDHRPDVKQLGVPGANALENGSIVPLGFDQCAFSAPPVTKTGSGHMNASKAALEPL